MPFFLLPAQMSNITGEEGSFSSGQTGDQEVLQGNQQKQLPNHQFHGSNSGIPSASASTNSNDSSSQQPQQQPVPKKKRNLPGTPGNIQSHP